MTNQLIRLSALMCIGVVLVSGTVLAQTGDASVSQSVSLSTGIDFTTGEYGGVDDIEDTYVPLTLSIARGRLGYRLTVPYLSVRAPSGTLFTDPGGQPIPGTGTRTTESGLGDVVGSVTLYDVINNRNNAIAMDLTGKVKLATADENKGLGTGEHDYSLQADFYKFFDRFTLLASAGYKVRGDPIGVDLENVFLASAGGIYQFRSQTRLGVIYDYRESAFATGEAIREVTGFVSKRLNDTWRLQFYLVNGQSDSSPDWGGGIMLKAALD